MELLIRTHQAKRPDGTPILVQEFWTMVDHSALRNGTDWLPGPKRFALSTGGAVRKIDETTFQIAATGQVLTTLR